MDTTGDADELGDHLGHRGAPAAQPLLTPETRAIAGAGLVLISVFGTLLFQLATFLLFDVSNGSSGPTTQYLLVAGPTGLLALAGAALGWSTRGLPLGAGFRGLAGAAVVVGGALGLIVVATVIGGYAFGPESPDGF